MLKVGIIGCGGRVSNMAKRLAMFDVPYQVTAIADPKAEEIKQRNDEFFQNAAFFETADELLEQAELDGVMVGTRCYLHADMACKVATRNIPLFLEKPVAITFDQVKALAAAFESFTAPVVVSFPLRVSPLCLAVKEVLDSGKVGTIEHVVAFNDVPYGSTYYTNWYRNYSETGGLFLQKATHDLDYISFLIDQRPQWICAMNAQRIYGGDKPFDLKCDDCDEPAECPESQFSLFYHRFQGDKVAKNPRRNCMFAEGIQNEDLGHCIVEYENGAQASYTQNFFARGKAGRRGARLYGYKGTIHFDWYENNLKVFRHHSPAVETVDFSGGMSHFGGDRELCYDFLMAMKEGRPSRTPIEAGILSALTCLWARESAGKRVFCEVKMPG